MTEKPHYIKSGPVPILRDWRSLPINQLTRGERVCRFIETYCIIPEGDFVGKPVRLIDEQAIFYLSIYDNPFETDTAIKTVARKNSKTGDIAFMLLAHIVGPEAVQNSRIISGAMSRDQAAEVYNYASKCVMLSEKLSSLCRIVPSKKQIFGIALGVEYQAISADAKTAHGKSPIVAILDEVGQIEASQSDFVDAITTAQGAYKNPLLVYISTQASTDSALFSTIIDDAILNQPPKTVCHVYTAPEDCDVMDEQAWKMANPALGKFRSIDDVRKQAEKAKRMPSFEATFRQLILNQRINTVAPFVAPNVWKANNGSPDSLDGLLCYGGLDLSSRTDLTAFALMGCDANGIWHVYNYSWTPEQGLLDRKKRDKVPYDLWVKQGYLRTTPGYTVDYDFVAKEIGGIVKNLDMHSIAFDRWRINDFKQACERMAVSLPLVEHGQGFKDMSPSLDELEADLLNARIRHGMNPLLTMAAGNAKVTRDPAGGRKLDKTKATGRIDPMVALTMARGASRGEVVKPKEYKMFFV